MIMIAIGIPQTMMVGVPAPAVLPYAGFWVIPAASPLKVAAMVDNIPRIGFATADPWVLMVREITYFIVGVHIVRNVARPGLWTAVQRHAHVV